MSTPLKKFFVVVDPTDDKHTALDRAIITAELLNPHPEIYVFVTVDPEAVDTRSNNPGLYRHQHWFEQDIIKPMTDAGLTFQIEISWSTEWQQSIMQAARRWGADSIYLSAEKKETSTFRRFFFTDSKWELLKGSDCPVALIRSIDKPKREVILAAVNFQATRDVQKELNNKILEEARRFTDAYGADLHIVNGYMDSLHYPDRGKLVHETGVIKEKIHVEPGYTDEVVDQVAREIGADVVIMGTLGQNGMLSSRRGNTAERLISALDTDVTVINYG